MNRRPMSLDEIRLHASPLWLSVDQHDAHVWTWLRYHLDALLKTIKPFPSDTENRRGLCMDQTGAWVRRRPN
jgi:hypothetical protein